MCSYLSKYQSAPALGGLQGLPMKGVLAFCADISVDSATHHIYGTTESLQSTLRTRMYSICLECPVLVSLCTSQAESGIRPLLCVPLHHGGQAGPGLWWRPRMATPAPLSSHWLWVTFCPVAIWRQLESSYVFWLAWVSCYSTVTKGTPRTQPQVKESSCAQE